MSEHWVTKRDDFLLSHFDTCHLDEWSLSCSLPPPLCLLLRKYSCTLRCGLWHSAFGKLQLQPLSLLSAALMGRLHDKDVIVHETTRGLAFKEV